MNRDALDNPLLGGFADKEEVETTNGPVALLHAMQMSYVVQEKVSSTAQNQPSSKVHSHARCCCTTLAQRSNRECSTTEPESS